MKTEVYLDYIPLPFGEVYVQWETSHVSLRESTIMNLWYLLVFGTIREIMHSTKFIICRIHNGSLGLDKEFPIHVDDIHKLAGLSMESEDVVNGFQGLGKHGRKKGEVNIYDNFGTGSGGYGALIESITHK